MKGVTTLTGFMVLMVTLLVIPLRAQQVQVTGAVFPSLPATTCTNTFIDVNLQLSCSNMIHNGNSVNVSGSTITVEVDYLVGIFCLPAIVNVTQNVNLGMLSPGNYTVVINGLMNSTTASTISTILTVNSCCSAVPVFTASDDTVCVGDSVYFANSSTGTTARAWFENNSPVGNSLNYGKRYTTAGTYDIKLRVSNATCSDSLIKTIFVSNPPIVDLGPDSTICPGSNLLLAAGANLDSVLWSDMSTNPTLTVTQPGTYYVSAYQNSCESHDTIVIGAYTATPVDLGADTALCINDTLVLDAFIAGGSYLWQDASTQSSFSVTTAGTYSVLVTDTNGCSSSDTIIVMQDNCYAGLPANSDGIFSLYPNPTSGKFSIEMKDVSGVLDITIRSITGQKLKKYHFEDTKTINLQITEPAGLYFIEVESNKAERAVLRVAKE